MRSGLCLLLAFPLFHHSFAQYDGAPQHDRDSPYRFNWKSELVSASGAGLLCAGGIFAHFQTRPITAAQVNALDPYDQPAFDRPAIYNWNPNIATASDALMYATFALPAFMMIDRNARKDFLVIGFIYAEVAMLTVGVTELTKGLVHRPRPYVYNTSIDMETRRSRDGRLSFFSGHTSTTAALCFATARIFSDYSDNETHEALVWTGAALFPAITGLLRYEAGKHFPSDIIAGYMVGATIGYLVPWLHRRRPVVKGLGIVPYSNGRNEAGLFVSYRL